MGRFVAWVDSRLVECGDPMWCCKRVPVLVGVTCEKGVLWRVSFGLMHLVCERRVTGARGNSIVLWS